MKKIILFTIFTYLAVLPFSTSAVLINRSVGGDVSYTLKPENPGSYENVTVKVTSFQIDLNKAQISWYQNGTLQKDGLGQTTFSFQAGNNGTLTSIRTVILSGDKTIEKTMTLNPADTDIVWEADNYVPPFYRGKALPGAQSSVKVSALPTFISEKGIALSPNDLIYSWKKDGTNISSGVGKKSVTIQTGSPLGENNISVKISNEQGDLVAEKSLILKPASPVVLFYEEKPLEGTNYDNALPGVTSFSEEEISVRAEPYFFSYPNSLSVKNLEFNWGLNGKGATPNEGTPKIITLRNESGQETTSTLSLSIRNLLKSFQKASSALVIKSTPNFGF